MSARMKKTTFRKLVLVGGLVFFVLLGAFMLTSYSIRRTVQENMERAEQSLMEQMEGKFEDYQHNTIQIVSSMVYSPTVYSCFSQSSVERVIANEDVSMVFSNTFLLDNTIADIFLYDENMERIASAGKEIEELEDYGFLKQWKEQITYSALFAMPETKTPSYALFFPVFKLESERYAEQIGMCVLVFNTQKLMEILSEPEIVSGGELVLIDDKEQILASSADREAGYLNQEEESKETRALAIDGWTLVLQGTKAGLSQELSTNTYFIAAAYLLASVLVLWLLIICYRSLVRPIQEMDHFVQQVSFNPQLRIEVKDKNEIGKVEQGLNQMLDSIAQKNAEIQEIKEWAYQAELAKKQLQILVYRNQIHPHFLYNTLDCIRAMAILNDQKPIAEITLALSRMFRFAVKEENVVTVEDEVNYTREYARIIDYRFNGKIKIQIQMEDTIANKPMIKLILQPIIENAVFHGLERKVGGGKVEASVCMPDEGRLRLEVADNGCGMSEKMLETLRRSLAGEQKEDSIGLPNICHRLKLFYGEEMSFSIDSTENKGTRVVIDIADKVEDRGIGHVSDFSGGR